MASNAELNLVIGLVDKASGPLAKLTGGLGTLAKIGGAAFLGGAVAGVGALGAALVTGIGDAREAAQVMAATENVIRSMGRTGAISADEIAQMSAQLSAAEGKSLFGDSDIQAGQNMLLTFSNINDVLPDATQAMVDMTQFMGGDMTSSATMLGKALDNPTEGLSALSRVGVSFSEQQKEQIKVMQEAGDMAGAQGVILEALRSQFGGAAEAAAKADGGMAMFKDRMGELAESIGARVLPVLNDLLSWLNSPAVQAGITAVVDGLFAAGEVLVSFGQYIGAVVADGDSLNDFLMGIPEPLRGIAEALGIVIAGFQEGGLAGAISAILPKLQEFGTNVLTWITEQAPIWGAQLLAWGQAFIDWIAPMIVPLLEQLGAFAQAMLTWVVEQLPVWGEHLLKFGLAAVAWVTAALGPLANQLLAFSNKMLNWVVDQLPGWGAKLADFGAKAIQWVLDALPGLAVNLGTFAGALIGWVLQTAIDLVPKLAIMAYTFLSWVVTDVIPELPGFLLKIWNALVLFVETAAVDIVPKLKDMAQKFLDWVENDVVPFLGEKMEAIKTTIIGWIDGAKSWAATALTSIGASIVQSLINGINSMIEQARAALNEIIGIINSIPVLPNISTIPGGGGGGSTGGGGGSSFNSIGGRTPLLTSSSSSVRNVTISIDARGATDPTAIEAAGYRGAQRALREAERQNLSLARSVGIA